MLRPSGLFRRTKETIWQRLHGLDYSPSRTPSPSIDLQEPTLPSTTDSGGTIQVKPNDRQTDTSTASDPQTTDAVPSTEPDQQPDAETESTNIKPPPRFFALIIGINEYKCPAIRNLSGAVPDADAVRDYLQGHLGVPSSQITNLRDDQATRTAIINEIDALSLNDDIKEGDPIMIYFAGHGGSADTPEGWEAGGPKIQLLIPCDCTSFGEKKHGVPDRTLGALLSRLASKKGDNITVILDCCHSGSGTRLCEDPPLLARGIKVVDVPSDLDQDIWKEFESSNGSERGTEVNAGFTHGGLRSHVLLAACGAEETAFEQKSRGIFTKGLLEALMTLRIDKLTYTGLLQRMPHLSRGQNPQCEGVNQHRIIFNAKSPGKSTIYYKIREEGGRYLIPVGTAHGIKAGAEFEVYQDQDSCRLLGTVIARELSAFSTTLDAKGSRFVLERDSVASQTCLGTKEHVLRIHVEDEVLRDLVKQVETTDPSQRKIQLTDRDQAEFGMALEKGKVVFNILDSVVVNYGLTRMPFILEPTPDVISPVIRAADHFYWHLRRTENQAQRGLSKSVEIEVAELEHDGDTYDDDLEPVLSPTQAGWSRGRDFDLQIKDEGTIYGWKIINNCKVGLYPAFFYFDNSDWSITSYYQPPTARGIVDTPLQGHRFLPVGYGDAGSVPHAFYLRDEQDLDVGFLKLFLSKEHVDLSHIAQPSPFAFVEGRGTAPALRRTPLLWDTVLIPVVQRRADK